MVIDENTILPEKAAGFERFLTLFQDLCFHHVVVSSNFRADWAKSSR
jgi:hypothetical protein